MKKSWTAALGAALSIAFGLSALPAAAAEAQHKVEEGLALQAARQVSVTSKGKRRWYEEKFDLSGMPEYKPEQQVSGKLRIWGNNYVVDGRVAELWRAGFKKVQPGVDIEYTMPTSLTAVPGLYTGAADIGLSRKITFYEQLGFERLMGYAPTEILGFTGSYDVPGWSNAVAIIVPKGNPIAKLSIEQLDGIFGAERDGGWIGTSYHPEFARGPEKNIRTWGQLGLTGEWADKPIHVYGYNLRYNLSYNFSDIVLQAGDKWNEKIKLFANKSRPDGTLYLEADQMQDAIRNDPYAIGYIGFNGQKDGLKTVAIAARNSANAVPITLRSVQDRSYPLLNDLFWYVARKPGTPMDPKVREFLRYMLSREAQEMIQDDAKFLPLPPKALPAEIAKLK